MAVKNPNDKGKISMIYSQFVNAYKDSTNHKRLAWIDDLQMDVTENEWEKTCVQAQTLLINTRFKMIQYNWIMRGCIAPEKI